MNQVWHPIHRLMTRFSCFGYVTTRCSAVNPWAVLKYLLEAVPYCNYFFIDPKEVRIIVITDEPNLQPTAIIYGEINETSCLPIPEITET